MTNYNFELDPRPAPRMSSTDRYQPRPIVSSYFGYRNHLRCLSNLNGLQGLPGSIESIIFHIPMPESWSKKKREKMNGQPHQQTPDLDNYLKGFLDALCPTNDKHIHSIGKLRKIWSVQGSIDLRLNNSE